MLVAIGSTNPVKIAAAEAVFSRLDGDSTIIGLSVESGVSAQPWGDTETRRGAVNRARAALARSEQAQMGVGFEGGVIETEQGLMTCAWCAVVDRGNTVGIGGSVNTLLPPAVEKALHSGGELGPAMDTLIGEANTKQGPGAVGILTDNLSDRQRAYEHILILALAPYRRPDLYRKSDLPECQEADN